MTQSQRRRLKPLLKKLMMEVKNELREEFTVVSEQKIKKLINSELDKLSTDSKYNLLRNLKSFVDRELELLDN